MLQNKNHEPVFATRLIEEINHLLHDLSAKLDSSKKDNQFEIFDFYLYKDKKIKEIKQKIKMEFNLSDQIIECLDINIDLPEDYFKNHA